MLEYTEQSSQQGTSSSSTSAGIQPVEQADGNSVQLRTSRRDSPAPAARQAVLHSSSHKLTRIIHIVNNMSSLSSTRWSFQDFFQLSTNCDRFCGGGPGPGGGMHQAVCLPGVASAVQGEHGAPQNTGELVTLTAGILAGRGVGLGRSTAHLASTHFREDGIGVSGGTLPCYMQGTY